MTETPLFLDLDGLFDKWKNKKYNLPQMQHENERRPSMLAYALTRKCFKELDGEKNPVPENIGVVAGEITSTGCEHFAIAFVVVGETLVLPVTLGIDIGRFVKRKLASKSS